MHEQYYTAAVMCYHHIDRLNTGANCGTRVGGTTKGRWGVLSISPRTLPEVTAWVWKFHDTYVTNRVKVMSLLWWVRPAICFQPYFSSIDFNLVTPHKVGRVVNMQTNSCSHCNHCKLVKYSSQLFTKTLQRKDFDSTITDVPLQAVGQTWWKILWLCKIVSNKQPDECQVRIFTATLELQHHITL